jgi:hypothetical protein
MWPVSPRIARLSRATRPDVAASTPNCSTFSSNSPGGGRFHPELIDFLEQLAWMWPLRPRIARLSRAIHPETAGFTPSCSTFSSYSPGCGRFHPELLDFLELLARMWPLRPRIARLSRAIRPETAGFAPNCSTFSSNSPGGGRFHPELIDFLELLARKRPVSPRVNRLSRATLQGTADVAGHARKC